MPPPPHILAHSNQSAAVPGMAVRRKGTNLAASPFRRRSQRPRRSTIVGSSSSLRLSDTTSTARRSTRAPPSSSGAVCQQLSSASHCSATRRVGKRSSASAKLLLPLSLSSFTLPSWSLLLLVPFGVPCPPP